MYYIRDEEQLQDDYDGSCCKHVSHIIKELSKEMNGPTILMLDEVLPFTYNATATETLIFDWSSLELTSNVDLFMAVSPAPTLQGQSYQLIPPSQPIILSQQLMEGYRNFAQLDRLLSCLKHHNGNLPSV